MDDVRKVITTMAGAIQDMQADTRANMLDTQANARDLKALAERMDGSVTRMNHMDETLMTMADTMTLLGQVLETTFQRQAQDRTEFQDLKRRVEALEEDKKGRPPAA